MLEQEEKVVQPYQEEIEKVNLGNADVIREVKVGSALEDSVKQRLIELLQEYSDIFSWSYEDMSGLVFALKSDAQGNRILIRILWLETIYSFDLFIKMLRASSFIIFNTRK